MISLDNTTILNRIIIIKIVLFGYHILYKVAANACRWYLRTMHTELKQSWALKFWVNCIHTLSIYWQIHYTLLFSENALTLIVRNSQPNGVNYAIKWQIYPLIKHINTLFNIGCWLCNKMTDLYLALFDPIFKIGGIHSFKCPALFFPFLFYHYFPRLLLLFTPF